MDMTHFAYGHLRPDLAAVSQSFSELAHAVLNTLPLNDQREACLQKLLEAKDCAVRAYLQGSDPVLVEPIKERPKGDVERRDAARAEAEAKAFEQEQEAAQQLEALRAKEEAANAAQLRSAPEPKVEPAKATMKRGGAK